MDTSKLKDNVSSEAFSNIQAWLTQPKYAEYRDELHDMIAAERWHDLEDAFFTVIEFGTGGRRGTVGIGSNRINTVTVGESAQALCVYARKADPEAPSKGIVIACDTRLSSTSLSKHCASVCAANGFKTYIFDGYRSTPELSFAVRHLGCAAGIVITASHNPPTDNGFKAYWSDGGQLVPPHDKGVLAEAAEVTAVAAIDFDEAVSSGAITLIGKAVDEAYIAAAAAEASGSVRDISIVYSPLHGAGQRNTLPVLQTAGFNDIRPVEVQMTPDGNFPTIETGKPNPEEQAANRLAVEEMMTQHADIAITNDPDADRIGVMVRHGDESIYLNGNQSAVLATDYVLQKMQSAGTLTHKHYIASTIVTTDMLKALAVKYGVTCYSNMLIGFKYIGELIRKKESTDELFVIGGEESYGLLKGTYARDKDGAGGALALAEYAAELKQDSKTLYDRLWELYQEHGLYLERLDTIMCPGADGFEKMQNIMQAIRQQSPHEIAGHPVTAVLDYQTLKRLDVSSGAETNIDCISGNVVVLELDNDARRRLTIRPSGTEPKLKVYTQWYETTDLGQDVAKEYENLMKKLKAMGETLEGILLSE